MTEVETGTGKTGDGIMEDVGALKELTGFLSKKETDCKEEKDDVASWITLIGRALLAVFK